MAVSANTVGKLFPPARYFGCETRLCSKLDQNACITLYCLIFDMAVVYGMSMVKAGGLARKISEFKLAEVGKFLLTLSKLGGLTVSAAWVITDLLFVASAAPGQGTLILGSMAAAASLLVLLAEFVLWILFLPAAVERLAVMLTLLDNFDDVEHFLCKENNEYDHVCMLLILVGV